MWSHERLHTLPPSIVKNLLDLMQLAIKTLQDSKSFPLQSANIGERGRPRSDVVPYRRRGDPPPLPQAFRTSEDTLRILIDMGFAEADVRRLSQTFRTNDVSALTNHLLESSSAPSRTVAAEPAVGTTMASIYSSIFSAFPSSSSTSSSNPASMQHRSADITDALSADATADIDVTAVPPVLESSESFVPMSTSSSNPDPNPSNPLSGSSQSSQPAPEALEEMVLSAAQPLPLIARKTIEDCQEERSMLQAILKRLHNTVPQTCLGILEKGELSSGREWGVETTAINLGVTREATTAMVLYKYIYICCFYIPINPNP
jgi:hypothetical protein